MTINCADILVTFICLDFALTCLGFVFACVVCCCFDAYEINLIITHLLVLTDTSLVAPVNPTKENRWSKIPSVH